MYSLYDYGRMVADGGRTTAYLEALKNSVGPESVVLDIGTGTGILAILAARLGAKKVYAVEADGIIDSARRLAEANGLAEGIEFIHGISAKVDLPERVDVIVSDLQGALP